jgi:hypothetical protein
MESFMSSEKNGVIIFDDGEKDSNHKAFKELSKVSLGDVRFPFGFFLAEEGGKTIVIPAAMEDRKKALLRAFPDIDQRAFGQGCHPNPFDTGCHGGCGLLPPGYRCHRLFEEDRRFFGCACLDMS